MPTSRDTDGREGLTGLLGRYVHAAHTATDPAAELELTARLARAAAELRDALAVELVIDGASYAEVGRRLGITRQAAHDAYASEVRAEMHRRIRHHTWASEERHAARMRAAGIPGW